MYPTMTVSIPPTPPPPPQPVSEPPPVAPHVQQMVRLSCLFFAAVSLQAIQLFIDRHPRDAVSTWQKQLRRSSPDWRNNCGL